MRLPLGMGGVQLISAGLIGEYIARLSNNVRQRPLYLIWETNLPARPTPTVGAPPGRELCA